MLTGNGLNFSKIVVAVGRSDLRKGVDGLAADIRLRYNLDPLEKDTLFLFKGTRNDRLKGLLWTGDRFIMLYIRLANGRFQWPKNADEARTLNSDEFLRLMEGYPVDPSVGEPRQVEKPDFKKARKRCIYRSLKSFCTVKLYHQAAD